MEPTLFSTKERIQVLAKILNSPEKEIKVRKLAKETKVSHSQVSKYLKILREQNIVNKKVNLENPVTKAIKVLLNLMKIEKAKITPLIRERFSKIQGIGLYGTWSKGTNEESADLDIWVRLQKSPKDIEIAKTRRELEQKIGAAVDITILTPERIRQLREKSDSFYFSLYHGIVLWGEGL